tara:strand:- start:1071 stop:1397 length:327 start_codon:yes stop_codon:yes gene_type:complete
MKFNKSFGLLSIVEKPEPIKIRTYTDSFKKIRVSMNIFLFEGKHFFKYLKNCSPHPERDEKELPKALTDMINNGILVQGIPIAEHVPDLTSKKDITELENLLNKDQIL